MKAVLFALVLAAPVAAHAGSTCGHGGSSGGSSSSSSSSSGGSSYSSSDSSSSSDDVASTPACNGNDDIHGYRQCSKFGAWHMTMVLPRLVFELGTNVRQASSGLAQQQGQVEHGDEAFAYRVVMPTAARDTMITSTIRMGVIGQHGVYGALEGELGGVLAGRSTTEMTTTGTFGSPTLAQGAALVVGAYGVAGVRNAVGRGSVAVELAGGVRSRFYNFDSSYHDCETTSSITVTQGVVEARARGELWGGPWFSFGATVGANLIDRGDWLVGAYIGLHTRAYAGGR